MGEIDWQALSVDERVATLIEVTELSAQRLADLRDAVQANRTTLDAAISGERERAEGEEQRIESRVESFVGNDLRLQAFGAGLLFCGIILTTWSVELAHHPLWLALIGVPAVLSAIAFALKQRQRERN